MWRCSSVATTWHWLEVGLVPSSLQRKVCPCIRSLTADSKLFSNNIKDYIAQVRTGQFAPGTGTVWEVQFEAFIWACGARALSLPEYRSPVSIHAGSTRLPPLPMVEYIDMSSFDEVFVFGNSKNLDSSTYRNNQSMRLLVSVILFHFLFSLLNKCSCVCVIHTHTHTHTLCLLKEQEERTIFNG